MNDPKKWAHIFGKGQGNERKVKVFCRELTQGIFLNKKGGNLPDFRLADCPKSKQKYFLNMLGILPGAL